MGRKITGGDENLEERRKRAYEGSIGPSITPFERGVAKYERWLGITMEELEGKRVLDIGSGPEEVFSKEAKKRGVEIISLSPELKYEDIREITKGGFMDIFTKGCWQKKSVASIVQELPFTDETFDVEVSSYGGIHYLLGI